MSFEFSRLSADDWAAVEVGGFQLAGGGPLVEVGGLAGDGWVGEAQHGGGLGACGAYGFGEGAGGEGL